MTPQSIVSQQDRQPLITYLLILLHFSTLMIYPFNPEIFIVSLMVISVLTLLISIPLPVTYTVSNKVIEWGLILPVFMFLFQETIFAFNIKEGTSLSIYHQIATFPILAVGGQVLLAKAYSTFIKFYTARVGPHPSKKTRARTFMYITFFWHLLTGLFVILKIK